MVTMLAASGSRQAQASFCAPSSATWPRPCVAAPVRVNAMRQELRGEMVKLHKKVVSRKAFAGEASRRVGKVVCQSLGEKKREASNVIQQETLISNTLASRWREIQGGNDWDGLLDPLDMDLRMELIRYGEFAQACYDTFDNASHSKYMGSSLFNKEKMLEKVGLPDTGYEITDFLFATSSVDSMILRNDAKDAWSRSSNWIGFIAVCTDEAKIKQMGRRDIVLAWRGTATKLEWAANLARKLIPCSLDARTQDGKRWNMKVMLEEGFLNLYTTRNSQTRYNQESVRGQILMELKRLIKKYDNEQLSITITGHSLGGALSVLSAYDIAISGVNRHGEDVEIKDFQEKTKSTKNSNPGKTKGTRIIPVTAFTFAGPRVGNNPFADMVRDLGVKILRVTNAQDMVPKVPSPLLNEEFTLFNNFLDKFPFTYSHVGAEIEIDHDLSPELRARGNPMNAHNMEAYLHLLTGYHGPNKPWNPVVDRDIALVNKASEFVCPKRTGIPGNWWQPENKGLVRNSEGKWVQVERDYEDIPDAVLQEKQEKHAQNSTSSNGNSL